MAYADPQSTVANGSATLLPRTGSGLSSGTFSSADGAVQLNVAHQSAKRWRRTARITLNKVVPDALQPSVNTPVYAQAYIVLDVPKMGFTAAEQVKLIEGLTTWLSASTNANASKLVGGEA
jgi:hypothetical protein